MNQDNENHVIICHAHGSYEAYACTLENAVAIFNAHLDNLDSGVRELQALRADPAGPSLYSANLMVRCLDEVAKASPGDELPLLRLLSYGPAPREGEDARAKVLATQQMQEELVLWLFRVKHSLEHRASLQSALNVLKPHEALSFLSTFAQRMSARSRLGLHFVDDELLEILDEVAVLQRNKWKPDARVTRVVSRYLDFVSEHLAHRDVRYTVSSLKPTY